MKKFASNVVIAFLSKILLIVSSIIAQRFILKSFGSEINGLTSSITQFITYFTLLEAGLGTASIQALYAPLYKKDKETIDAIISATDKQYKKIGLIFLGLTVILAFLMPFITNSDLDYFLIFIITILMGLSQIINYFFIGKFNSLLYADRNVYIINILDSVLGVLFSFVKVIVINMGGSIVLVLLLQLLSPLLRVAFLYVYVKIKYPNVNFKAKPKNEYISKRWSVLTHQVVGMITHNTDVTILTVCSTLSLVSVYSVYNYIYSNINNIMQSTLLIAPQASFGRLYQSDDKQKFIKFYNLYEGLVTYIVFVVLCVAASLTIPFVKLYAGDIKDINYVDSILGLLFAISIIFSTIRIPSIMMVNIAGKFKETQKGSIIEAIINIVVSIPMFILIGMRGLLIGTCCAMMYRAIDVFIYSYKHIIHKKILSYVFIFITYLLFGIIYVYGISDFINIDMSNWGNWLFGGAVYFIIACLWFAIPIIIFYSKDVKLLFKLLKQKFKKIKKNNEEL